MAHTGTPVGPVPPPKRGTARIRRAVKASGSPACRTSSAGRCGAFAPATAQVQILLAFGTGTTLHVGRKVAGALLVCVTLRATSESGNFAAWGSANGGSPRAASLDVAAITAAFAALPMVTAAKRAADRAPRRGSGNVPEPARA
jgi:hypothetical protein